MAIYSKNTLFGTETRPVFSQLALDRIIALNQLPVFVFLLFPPFVFDFFNHGKILFGKLRVDIYKALKTAPSLSFRLFQNNFPLFIKTKPDKSRKERENYPPTSIC